MKQLFLIRHAAAVSEQFSGNDFDRILSETGKAEAENLAGFMAAKSDLPVLFLTSPARRTKQTAEIILEKLELPASCLQPAPLLYNAAFSALMSELKKIPDAHFSAAIVAHNPGISQLATVLSSFHPYQFGTASCLCLEFQVKSWSDLESGSGKEIWYYCP
jgi:phosphohistidine phosphatase